jgi:hypothetical protein
VIFERSGEFCLLRWLLIAFRLAWGRERRALYPLFHFHDLRHEAISRFFEMGLITPEVASISGHRYIRILMRYAHPMRHRADGQGRAKATRVKNEPPCARRRYYPCLELRFAKIATPSSRLLFRPARVVTAARKTLVCTADFNRPSIGEPDKAPQSAGRVL